MVDGYEHAGLAYSITTECGYRIGMGAKMDAVIFVPNLVPQVGPFCFAQTNSKLKMKAKINAHGKKKV